jgi:hypothetical protein
VTEIVFLGVFGGAYEQTALCKQKKNRKKSQKKMKKQAHKHKKNIKKTGKNTKNSEHAEHAIDEKQKKNMIDDFVRQGQKYQTETQTQPAKGAPAQTHRRRFGPAQPSLPSLPCLPSRRSPACPAWPAQWQPDPTCLAQAPGFRAWAA